MSDRHAERNRQKREQNRARYDTPREDSAPTPEQRRLQLTANIYRVPARLLPAPVVAQLWERRLDLLAALEAAGTRADAAAPLEVYVARFFGIDQAPETAEDIPGRGACADNRMEQSPARLCHHARLGRGGAT
jgi:hypothetical protein